MGQPTIGEAAVAKVKTAGKGIVAGHDDGCRSPPRKPPPPATRRKATIATKYEYSTMSKKQTASTTDTRAHLCRSPQRRSPAILIVVGMLAALLQLPGAAISSAETAAPPPEPPQLNGRHFRITAVEEGSFLEIRDDPNGGGRAQFSGYLADVIEAVSKPSRANFTYDLLTPSGLGSACAPQLHDDDSKSSTAVTREVVSTRRGRQNKSAVVPTRLPGRLRRPLRRTRVRTAQRTGLSTIVARPTYKNYHRTASTALTCTWACTTCRR